MNKRRYHRFEVQNIDANISNGVDSFSGTVNDVSRVGLLLADIPKDFSDIGENLSIIVSARGKDYKLQVVRKWMSKNDSEKRMGVAILDAPLDWTSFVMDCEPRVKDNWASTTHLPDC